MVQLRDEAISTPKTPKMAKSKTPKKNGAAATPVMAKTPNEKIVKSPKSSAVKPLPQTPKSAKKQKAKTPKKKEVVEEDVAMESVDAEEEELVLEPVVKQSLKSAKKQKTKTTKKNAATPVEAEVTSEPMESDDAEEADSDNDVAPMKEAKPLSPVKKNKGSKKNIKEVEDKPAEEGEAHCVYVRNLQYALRKNQVENHFSQFGPLVKAYLSRNKTNPKMNAGFAFVTFENKEDMNKAVAAVHTIKGRQFTVQVAAPKGEKRKREDDSEGPAPKKINHDTENEVYVGRVSFDSTEDGVKQYFSKFGTVVNVALPQQAGSNLNRGFAFVKFADAAGMNAALSAEKLELDSRRLVIKQAGLPKETREATPKAVYEFELYVGSLAKTTTQETITEHFAKYGALKAVVLPKDHKNGGNKTFAFVAFEKKASLDAALMEDHQVDGADLVVRDAKSKKDDKVAPKKAAAKAAVVEAESDDDEAEDDDDEAEDDDDEAEDDDDEAEDDDEAADEDDDEADDDDEEAEDDDDDDDDE